MAVARVHHFRCLPRFQKIVLQHQAVGKRVKGEMVNLVNREFLSSRLRLRTSNGLVNLGWLMSLGHISAGLDANILYFRTETIFLGPLHGTISLTTQESRLTLSYAVLLGRANF